MIWGERLDCGTLKRVKLIKIYLLPPATYLASQNSKIQQKWFYGVWGQWWSLCHCHVCCIMCSVMLARCTCMCICALLTSVDSMCLCLSAFHLKFLIHNLSMNPKLINLMGWLANQAPGTTPSQCWAEAHTTVPWILCDLWGSKLRYYACLAGTLLSHSPCPGFNRQLLHPTS